MRRVVVTGGSAGIGLSLCRQLAGEEKDFKVYLAARNKARGEDAVAAIKKRHPSADVSLIICDVGRDESVASAAAAVEADLGSDKLFAVVNNAGVGLSATASAEDILNINYVGPKRVSAAFMPLLQAEGARIVNVGSGAGSGYVGSGATTRKHKKILTSLYPPPSAEEIDEVVRTGLDSHPNKDRMAYGLSKAALASWTVAMAAAHPNILWSCCTPGFINTKLVAGMGARLQPDDVIVLKHLLLQPLEGESRDPATDRPTDRPTDRTRKQMPGLLTRVRPPRKRMVLWKRREEEPVPRHAQSGAACIRRQGSLSRSLNFGVRGVGRPHRQQECTRERERSSKSDARVISMSTKSIFLQHFVKHGELAQIVRSGPHRKLRQHEQHRYSTEQRALAQGRGLPSSIGCVEVNLHLRE